MNLKDMTKEEIEALSYTDLTCILLTENKKPMSTAEIFKKICEILGYSDAEYSEKIGDYYTSLTIDKRFVLLDDAKWDLRKNHAVELKVEDDEEEETAIDDEDIDTDDDLDDLSVLSDDDIEEEN